MPLSSLDETTLLRDFFSKEIGVRPGNSVLNRAEETCGGYQTYEALTKVSPKSPSRASVPAGVLLAFHQLKDGLHLYFVQRSETLSVHAGQIGLPGGRLEESDRDEKAAALREAHEEIGLDPGNVEVLGILPTHATRTGFLITPVVGFIKEDFDPVPDAEEVIEVFRIPFRFFWDDKNRFMIEQGILLEKPSGYAYQFENRLIWGATAGILNNFILSLKSNLS